MTDFGLIRAWRARRLRGALERIVADPRYARGIAWGEPRSGHPEGSVFAHIAELEANLDRLAPRLRGADTVWALRVLVHVHDTFKCVAEPDVPLAHPRAHGALARAFLAEFVRERDLLAICEHHDAGLALWRRAERSPAEAAERLDALVRTIRDWDLFLAFAIVDGCTAGKSRTSLEWFIDAARERVRTRVDRSWLAFVDTEPAPGA